MIETKRCYACTETKPVTDFYKSNVTYYQKECKACNKLRKGAWHKTEAGKRLLRPEMLDALLEYLPTSKAEFQEVVPAYLRTGTVTYEAKFLDDVLSLIADYA